MTDDTQHAAGQATSETEVTNPRRRQFLRNSAGVGLGFVGSTILGACGGDSDDAFGQSGGMNGMQDVTDVDILNFALNLEYLEAEFYVRAATGKGLADNLTNAGDGSMTDKGDVTGGRMVDFSGVETIREYANEVALDELNHVKTLRTALGGAAVARPEISLDMAFTTAARAAGVVRPDEPFDAFANPTNFLLASYIFEDVGVTAYKGGAALIQNSTNVTVAAGFLAAEAYHAGLVRTVLYDMAKKDGNEGLFDTVMKISKLRDGADGSQDLDQGIAPQDITLKAEDLTGSNDQVLTASNIAPLSDGTIPSAPNRTSDTRNFFPGEAFGRTVPQVHNVVYLTGMAKSMGGFFPNGTNMTGGLSSTSGDFT